VPIRILICDDIKETRENIRRLLSLDEEMMVVGEAENGEVAIVKTKELRPDVILMDVNMPVMDGILATEEISVKYPDVCIIMLSVQGEQVYLKKAMLAGARDYIVKPFSNEELINGIKRVYQLERRKKMKQFSEDGLVSQPAVDDQEEFSPEVLTVFNTKGGVGKSTIATNLSVSLFQLTNKKIVLLDFDLQFGDVGAMLNIIPRQTITELVQDIDDINVQTIERYLHTHKSGVKVLPAPLRPEFAELIKAEHIEKIVKILKESYDYIVIDTAPLFNDINLSILDVSDQILLVLALDLPTVKNTKLTLEVIESLNYKAKTKVILNRSSDEVGLRCDDVEKTLDMKVTSHIPSHGKIVVASLNKGVPFVISNPGTKISDSLFDLARLVSDYKGKRKNNSNEKKSFLSRIFG